ncbi:hypothetical protein [Metaclostridioides mangenotii]|uniref:hypothetical protein n=1 Tax=Metaclostridioides mangenotii TaxID=1540 RepID=UPI0028EE7A3E|nr:hypothetical protein [Clostridioides mangenotii]
MDGFKKMDELEMQISLKSIKIAWFYTIMFLFIWTCYDYFTEGEWGLPFFIFITQNLVLLGSQYFLKRKYK